MHILLNLIDWLIYGNEQKKVIKMCQHTKNKKKNKGGPRGKMKSVKKRNGSKYKK